MQHHHSNPGNGPEDPDLRSPIGAPTSKRPYWQRAHRDWRFWVAVVFLFAALAIYIGTVDLSSVPWTFHR